MNIEQVIDRFKKHPVEEVENRADLFEPLVTVVVCTYNHESYIQKCLEGIINQKVNFKFELYVGEDDSTDKTRLICLEYAKKYPEIIRLFLHNKENKIFINGRPTGRFNMIYSFLQARGKYIALCEGDDYWTDENKLQEQVNFLEANQDFSLCFTNIRHVNKSGVIVTGSLLDYKRDIFTHETFVAKISPPTLSTVFRRDALPGNFPEEFLNIINADMFLKAAVSQRGRVKYINKITGSKCQHEGGIYVGSSYFQREEDKLFTYSVMLKYFESKKVKENIKRAMNLTYAKILYNSLVKRKVTIFLKTLVPTLRFYVLHLQLPPLKFFYSRLKNKSDKMKIQVENHS